MEREQIVVKNVPKQNWQKNIQIPFMKIGKSLLSSSWWLNQPNSKNVSQNGNLPQFCGMKITKLFELPQPSHMTVAASFFFVSIQVTAALEGAICSSAMALESCSQVKPGGSWSRSMKVHKGALGVVKNGRNR